jgi:hypothetical protein
MHSGNEASSNKIENTLSEIDSDSTEPQTYRLKWKKFDELLSFWLKWNIEVGGEQTAYYTTIEESSLIYLVHKDYISMVETLSNTPTGRMEGLESAIEGIKAFKGFPAMSIDINAAAKLRKHRSGLKPKPKWANMIVLYDPHGAIVLPKTRVELNLAEMQELLQEIQDDRKKETVETGSG